VREPIFRAPPLCALLIAALDAFTDARAIAAMDMPATPVVLLFPRYGFEAETLPVPPAEACVQMTQTSANYVALGKGGFRALTGLIADVPSVAIDYPDGASAIEQVEALWSSL
jgi:hypothetical protein